LICTVLIKGFSNSPWVQDFVGSFWEDDPLGRKEAGLSKSGEDEGQYAVVDDVAGEWEAFQQEHEDARQKHQDHIQEHTEYLAAAQEAPPLRSGSESMPMSMYNSRDFLADSQESRDSGPLQVWSSRTDDKPTESTAWQDSEPTTQFAGSPMTQGQRSEPTTQWAGMYASSSPVGRLNGDVSNDMSGMSLSPQPEYKMSTQVGPHTFSQAPANASSNFSYRPASRSGMLPPTSFQGSQPPGSTMGPPRSGMLPGTLPPSSFRRTSEPGTSSLGPFGGPPGTLPPSSFQGQLPPGSLPLGSFQSMTPPGTMPPSSFQGPLPTGASAHSMSLNSGLLRGPPGTMPPSSYRPHVRFDDQVA